MARSSTEDKFVGLWNRARNLTSLDLLTPELMLRWAKEAGFENPTISEQGVGRFHPLPSIVLAVDGEKACFPKMPEDGDEQWRLRRSCRQKEAELWNKVEWFAPLWVSMRKANQLLNSISTASNERALELFKHHTSTVYTLAFEAVCIEQVMTEAPRVRTY